MENDILDCIAALSPENQPLVRSIVQRVWKGREDWKARDTHGIFEHFNAKR